MNELEEAFDRGQKYYLPEMYRIAQPNTGWLAGKATGAHFAPSQLPDRILLHRKVGNFCIELKQCQGKTFSFARLPDHQGKALENFAEKVGKAYVMIAFQRMERVFAIPIIAYRFIERTIGRKSMSLSDILNVMIAPLPDFPRDFPILEIPVDQLQVNTRLNLSVLATRDLRAFLNKEK